MSLLSFSRYQVIARKSFLPPTNPARRYRASTVVVSHAEPCLQHLQRTTRDFSTALSPTPEENDNVPAIPIDFSTSSEIKGEESNVAFVTLKEGQVLRAESGAMIFMTEGIEMDTKLAGASSAFTRFLTGQNLFLTDFRYKRDGGGDGSGTLALGTDFPSKILRLNLADHPNQSLICQRGAFLASNPTVDIQTEFTQSLTAGFFGGQGFILQRLTGEGDVLVKAGGTIVKKNLEEGEVIRVTSGSIVAFQTSCQYNVQMMPGIKNALFGGEGLFITTLTGPGLVWLQGMPPDRMIAEIARRVPSGGGIGLGIPIPMGGGGSGGVETTPDSGDAAAAVTAASSDAAIETDRQATVATSSGIPVDGDSPQALFGDAAPKDSSTNQGELTESTFPPDDSSTTTFSNTNDDQSSFSSSSLDGSEQGFDDSFGDEFDEDFSTPPFEGSGPADGELYNDTSGSSTGLEGGSSEESSSGLFRMLWDFVSGGSDE